MRSDSDFHQRYGSRSSGSTTFSARGRFGRLLAVILTAMLAGQTAMAKTKKEKPAHVPPGSSINGKIVGDDGKPIRGATVTVKSLDGEMSWISKPSDKGGRFNLRGMHFGWAELVVTTDRGGSIAVVF